MKAVVCILAIVWLALATTYAPAAQQGPGAAATNAPSAAAASPDPAMSPAAAIAVLRLCGARVDLDESQSVESVSAASTKISDAGLKYLERLPMLTELGLSQTRVTDAGLQGLEILPRLVGIDLRGTTVSKPQRARLEKLCMSHLPR